MESRSPSPLPSPPGRGNSRRAALNLRQSVCLSLLAVGAKRRLDEGFDGLIARQVGEQFSLSCIAPKRSDGGLGERAGVRASVELTLSGNARRELEMKSGRKVVTSENYLALTQAAKKVKQAK